MFSAFIYRTFDIRNPERSDLCQYDVSCCSNFDAVVYVGCVHSCRVSLTLQRQIMHQVKEVEIFMYKSINYAYINIELLYDTFYLYCQNKLISLY